MSFERAGTPVDFINLDKNTSAKRSMENAVFDEAGVGNGRSRISSRPYWFMGVKIIPRVRSAFTLVELLVVISIIAILASFLLPALGKVKDKGRSIVCTGNLKQLGTAVGMYADDFSGYFPGNNAGSARRWTIELSSYLGNFNSIAQPDGKTTLDVISSRSAGPFHCPSDHWHGEAGAHYPIFSYGQNYYMNSEITQGAAGAKKIHMVRQPASKLYAADGMALASAELTDFKPKAYMSLADTSFPFRLEGFQPQMVHFRHDGGKCAMILFADFHVNSGTLSSLSLKTSMIFPYQQ